MRDTKARTHTSISPALAGRETTLLSRRQVARLLGVHTETIKRYQRRGLLPAIVLNSRLVRYERIAVEKLLAGGRVG